MKAQSPKGKHTNQKKVFFFSFQADKGLCLFEPTALKCDGFNTGCIHPHDFYLSFGSPACEKAAASVMVLFCICRWLCVSSVKSPAKCKSFSCVHKIHWIQFFSSFWSVVVLLIHLMVSRDKNESTVTFVWG